MKQLTISKSITYTGKGLHTGKDVTITLLPALCGEGIRFQRTDLEGKPLIEAIAGNVFDTARGTSLKNSKGNAVRTVEHLLSALSGCGVNNILIQIDSEEIPIADGSAQPFVQLLEEAGIAPQEDEQDVYKLTDVVRYQDVENNIELIAIPADKFRLSVTVDYHTPVLSTQYAELNDIEDFKAQIAPCRTFCFLHEILPLIQHNLIKGGDISNAIVYVDRPVSESEKEEIGDFFGKKDINVSEKGILGDVKLLFDNESARHKLLDLLGDMALIGQPVQAHIIAKCPGHAANTQFAKMLANHIKKDKETPHFDPQKPSLLSMEDIKKLLPHRPPFLLIDKIIEIESDRIVGVKNVTMNEPFFVGHFPDKPVMPGVLIMEGLAQTGGILVLKQVPDPENYLTYFLKMNNVRWRQQVVPGDTLVYELKLLEPVRFGLVHMSSKAFVNNKLVAEGDLMAQIVHEKGNEKT